VKGRKRKEERKNANTEVGNEGQMKRRGQKRGSSMSGGGGGGGEVEREKEKTRARQRARKIDETKTRKTEDENNRRKNVRRPVGWGSGTLESCVTFAPSSVRCTSSMPTTTASSIILFTF
jgi:hypothetical protein